MSKKLPFVFLDRLSQKGESFNFSSKKPCSFIDPYIQRALSQKRDYEISFTIKPLDEAYEVVGEVETSLLLECVVCLRGYKEPLKNSFSEIWLKSSHHSECHSYTDLELKKGLESPYFQPLKSSKVHLGQWLEELILSLKPSYPKPSDCDEACVHRKKFMLQGQV